MLRRRADIECRTFALEEGLHSGVIDVLCRIIVYETPGAQTAEADFGPKE
jgi:hypothetical protein